MGGNRKSCPRNSKRLPQAELSNNSPSQHPYSRKNFAVVKGYGPGRYTNVQKSFGTLVFEVPNTRRGVLTISADGKTLTEKGFIRRTTTVTSNQRGGALSGQQPQVSGKTACLDEITGVFHRVTMPGRNY
jgi:hypothetical protein